MFNLEKTLNINNIYNRQRDFYLKTIFFSFPIFLFLEILRNQISEINLLQLIPGFYLLLLLTSFVFLIFFSDFIFQMSIQKDQQKKVGTKTREKLIIFIITKLQFFLVSLLTLFFITTIIPSSLESFNTYGEQTLENLWSFDEVLNLESILFLLLLFLSQIPIFFLSTFNTEIAIRNLPEIWKILTLGISIFSGILTPTIDASTQLTFSFATLFLYSLIIFICEKRLQIKNKGNSSLTS
jgi:hypothetical protein